MSTHLYSAIHAQPAAVRTLLSDWDSPSQVAEQLTQARRVFLVGIGTSLHAAIIGEYLLRQIGIDARAIGSYEFVTYPPFMQSNDALIFISHRGNKHYGTKVVQRAATEHIPVIGLTGKNSKLEDVSITLETVDQDPSSTHSISYIGSLVRLGQLAVRLAALYGKHELAQQLEQGLLRLPEIMEDILSREREIQHIAQEAVAQQRRLYFIGAGPNAATAREGALKVKEAAYITAQGFEVEQTIHGPLVAFEAQDLIIPICVPGPGQERMADLLLALSEIGSHIWLLGDYPSEHVKELAQRSGWTRFALTSIEFPELLTPIIAALPVQLLADFLAAARGTNADTFRRDHEAYQRATSHYQL